MGSYANYLQSTHWNDLREQVLNRARGKCEKRGCNRDATQIHHLTYERLGQERLRDLQALCFPCHQNCHPEKEFDVSRASIPARNFDCQFCPSEHADLFIGDSRLHFICSNCGESSWQNRAHRKKMERQKAKREHYLENKDVTCHICYKVLSNIYGKNQHLRDKHNTGPFASARRKTKQKQKITSKKNPLTCICGKEFSDFTSLRNHQRKGHVSL